MIRFNSKYPPQQSMYPPEIFLTYANFPIESFPNAFEDVLDKWAKIEFWNKDPEHAKSIIAFLKSGVAEIKKATNIPFSKEIKEDLENKFWEAYTKRIYRSSEGEIIYPEPILFEVYGRNIIECKGQWMGILFCKWGGLRKKIFETNNLKCFECDHKYFLSILEDISRNIEYSKIPGLYLLIRSYGQKRESWTIESSDKRPFKETIKPIIIDSFDGGWWSFPKCLAGAVTQSLINFLINNDRRKIKKCVICGDFFIAMDLKRELCYPPKKCEKFRKRNAQREIMRKKRNKTGPGFDPRYI